MTSPQPLRVWTAFGSSLSETFLLASLLEETFDAQGNPVHDARTFVLRLAGDRAVFHEQLDLPITASRYSPSGVAYCTSFDRATIHKWQQGLWSTEVFSDKPVDLIRYIFVVPGDSSEADTLFLAGRKRIFLRRAGKWSSVRALGEGMPFQMDGSRVDQIFIGGAVLSMWDGHKLVELKPPPGGMGALALSADDRVVGGDTHAYASTPAGGWERLDASVQGVYVYARFGDAVYAVSDEKGLVRIYPGPAKGFSPSFDPLGIVAVGDGLIAYGEGRAFAFDGKQCVDVRLPLCEVGKMPV